MSALAVVALSLACQAAPSSDAPPADVAPAPVVEPSVAPRAPPPARLAMDDVDARYAKTHAVLTAFADDARAGRLATAVASGVVGAGLIGAGITYVAVSNLDGQLSQKDHEDTQLAGFVIGGTALVPAAIMVAQLVSATPEEARLAAFTGAQARDDKQARIEAARDDISKQASASSSLAPTLGGVGFIAGGLVSAAAGGIFLALPHIRDVERGPMTHATGAELIGAGVSSVGIGAAMIAAGAPGNAALQARVLDADAPPTVMTAHAQAE